MRLLLAQRGVRDGAGREMDGLPKRPRGTTTAEALLLPREGATQPLANHVLRARGLPLLSLAEAESLVAAASAAVPAMRRLGLFDVMVLPPPLSTAGTQSHLYLYPSKDR